ncbi:Aste57867_5982 [Aphanomyces stellatus]|uniref:Aste57867_5982 protein n=1 Tax=Aphanomyces stellatus TaxID=120398 RepID=A0A485KFC6_9STRA|nr:hypothetical protein As57867_005968 [Aphanomyces stellatus]VFT82998.1 Aste57867_5982 [Aphanomyces stellatus]
MLDAHAPVVLYQLNILDPTQVEFAFFAWSMLVDWTFGTREVVSFTGDAGSMTVLTEYLPPLHQPVNDSENQVHFSLYLRSTVFYVTYAMIALAALVLLYSIVCRGFIEVLNLFFLERVGATVWVGRSLLFVRSITAVGLLSTSLLELHTTGFISSFVVPSPPVYKTLLAANEVTWIVAIANDLAMLFTHKYTAAYADANSCAVWLVTVVLSLTVPVQHSLDYRPRCSVAQMDFQVVCHAGTLTIGFASRFLTLVAVVVCTNLSCYVATRIRFKGSPPPDVPFTSIFLYGGAKYLFEKRHWVHDGVYYMDRMSAVLNGVLTLKWHGALYGFDVKSWRMFHIDLPQNEVVDGVGRAVPHMMQHAMPMFAFGNQN